MISLVELLREPYPVGFGLRKEECDATFDGSPPPLSDWFWGVHSSLETQLDSDVDFTTKPVVHVTVSAPAGAIPFDRLGPDLMYGEGMLADRLETFAAWLARQQYVWLNLANAKLQEGHEEPVNGFIEPVFSIAVQTVKKVTGEHWQSSDQGERAKGKTSPAGLVAVVRLSGFKRIQYLEAAG